MAIDKRPTRVAAMFDAIAARYDLLNRLLSAGIDRRWRRRAIRSLELTGRESVVDVCTGTADVALTAVEARPGAARVVGIDFSGEMLRLGARKVRAQGPAGRILLARGDATRLPIRTGSVDAATVAFGIRNVENPERGLAEMYRALAPGGRLAILEFSIPSSAAGSRASTFRTSGSCSRASDAWCRGTAPPTPTCRHRSAASSRPRPCWRCWRRAASATLRPTPLTGGIVTLYTARK